MVKLVGICLAIGMVAVVFGQVLFSSQDDPSELYFKKLARILLRHRILTRIQGNGYGDKLQKFSWNNCGASSDPLDIETFTLSPDPVKLPGSVNFSISGAFNDVLASPIKLNVTMKMNVGGTWVTLPCIDNIGTCVYDDVCVLLSQVKTCPAEVKKEGFNCTCPFPKVDTISIPENSEYRQTTHAVENLINIDKKPFNFQPSTVDISGGAQVPEGDYMIIAYLTRSAGRVGCYQLYVSVAH